MTTNLNIEPDIKISVNQTFGIESDMQIEAFSKKNEYVPNIDKNYKFDKETTLAILSGFSFNKRCLISGYHGTGKSTHIEQVAARLNWPCIRVNLDSHISRIDLIGKDAIVIKMENKLQNLEKEYCLGQYKIQLLWYLMNMMLEGLMLCLLFKEFWRQKEILLY